MGKTAGMNKILLMILLCLPAFLKFNAFAGTIEQGTISTAASSNLLFTHQSGDEINENDSLRLSGEIGYFFADNWEIGFAIDLFLGFYDSYESKGCFFRPYIGYHYSLYENQNLYIRFGTGVGISEITSDKSSDRAINQTLLFTELGYESFITQNISIDLGLLGMYRRREYDSEYDFEENERQLYEISTLLKFKIYY
ncbi:MAG: hypothetical protein PVI90_13045 [Desulfobacteraceae bacterium]|jgi:hypothetical protein